jgi:hypothetical protein
MARDNAVLNGLQGSCSFVEDDVEQFLRDAVADGEQWDIVGGRPGRPAASSLQPAACRLLHMHAASASRNVALPLLSRFSGRRGP